MYVFILSKFPSRFFSPVFTTLALELGIYCAKLNRRNDGDKTPVLRRDQLDGCSIECPCLDITRLESKRLPLFFPQFFFAPPRNRVEVIFSLRFICQCLCVRICLSVWEQIADWTTTSILRRSSLWGCI